MASTATVAPPPVLNSGQDSRITPQGTASHTESSRGGGRGRQGIHTGEGQRGGRGRGRGQRGNRGDGRGKPKERPRTNDVNRQELSSLTSPRPGGGGISGDRSTRDAKTAEGDKLVGKRLNTETEDPEGEVCFICASSVIHNSIAPCNHRTCHICALRLRALYKTRACAHCRVRSPLALFISF